MNNLPITYFFSKSLILVGLFSRYRYNILIPNLWKKRQTFIFTPFYRHIVGIRISDNSVGHFSNDNNSHDLCQKNLKLCSNSRSERQTSTFRTFYRGIVGIRIFGSSISHIQMTITLQVWVKKIPNFCSNLSSECLLSKTFRPHLRIPYHSKVIVKMVTEGHF